MKLYKTIALTTCLLTSSFTFAAQNYIQDPQLTEYRSNKGKSDVWISHEKSSEGLGDVGSSKDKKDHHVSALSEIYLIMTSLPP